MSNPTTEYVSLASECKHSLPLQNCVRCMRIEIERLWREHDEDMNRMERAAEMIEKLTAELSHD